MCDDVESEATEGIKQRLTRNRDGRWVKFPAWRVNFVVEFSHFLPYFPRRLLDAPLHHTQT